MSRKSLLYGPCYVKIGKRPGATQFVRLRAEDDGTLLFSRLTTTFSDAIGLRFKTDLGAWRGVRLTNGVFHTPLDGWGDREYTINTINKSPQAIQEMLSELIVLGLPYSTTDNDLKTYFKKFGTLKHYEVILDTETKKSRGFGIIQYISAAVQEEVLSTSHSLGGRNLEVRFPNKEGLDNIPTKVSIGRLPNGTTVDDLKDCFYEYAPLVDAYIHKNKHFVAVGFVTFHSQLDAREAVDSTRVIKGSLVTVNIVASQSQQQGPVNSCPLVS